MVKKNDSNQAGDDQLTHIILQLDYDRKIILPIEKALEYMQIKASGKVLREPYNKPKVIEDPNRQFAIEFTNEKLIKMMMLDQLIDPPEEE